MGKRVKGGRAGWIFAGAALLALAGTATAVAEATWTQVDTGITGGISGVAAAPSGWVMVRDNKVDGQNRVALLSAERELTPLAWPGTAPRDLEAIDSVPNSPDRYVVVTSVGRGKVIEVWGTTVRVVRSLTLPEGRVENEGFALTTLKSRTVAVWGNRGGNATPGRLYAAVVNLGTGVFRAVANASVTVPHPTGNLRHISDVEVIGGRIVVSSASDGGNNGPFASALYDVGTVSVVDGRARLHVSSPMSLETYQDHKIEGIACNGDLGILGSDDENLGGWVTDAAFCLP